MVGAWVWDEELGFGIATEINKAEAFIELNHTKITILTGTIMLVLAIIGAWYLSMAIRREVARSAELAILAKDAAEQGKSEADKATRTQ